MSFPLNYFKGKMVGESEIAWSLGEYVVGNYTTWMVGYEVGTKQTIYKRLENVSAYSRYDSFITHTPHGVYRVVGFGESLDDAIAKVNRMITGATLYLKHTTETVCPDCGHTEYSHWMIEDYKWKDGHNAYSYHDNVHRISMEGDREFIQLKPSTQERYCDKCMANHPELEDDLPF